MLWNVPHPRGVQTNHRPQALIRIRRKFTSMKTGSRASYCRLSGQIVHIANSDNFFVSFYVDEIPLHRMKQQ